MQQKRSIGLVVISRLAGLIIFLLALIAANVLGPSIGVPSLLSVIGFLNANLAIILALFAFLLAGEALGAMPFPFNLPAPVANAIGGALLVAFLFSLFPLIDQLSGTSASAGLAGLQTTCTVVVFSFVLVFGYAFLFACRLFHGPACPNWREQERAEREEHWLHREKRRREWREIGDEFRGLLLDSFRRAREELRGDSAPADKEGAAAGKKRKK